MRRKIYQEIEIPAGVEVKLENNKLSVKGPAGENSREFKTEKLDFKVEGNKIILGDKKATKTEKKIINTIASHIKNMIKGVQEKFEYTLKICSSHFPMTVEISGNKAKIKNFLGEKIDRMLSIPQGAEVEIKKDIITIKSNDREIAGQAAANFEAATKIRGRDKRVFQDGVYITNKCGREM